MKLVLFDNGENPVQSEVYLKDMVFLCVKDCENINTDYTLQFTYCAHDENGNVIRLCQFYKGYYNDGTASKAHYMLKNSPYYNINEKNISLAFACNFFVTNKEPMVLTDFLCTYDSKKNKFYFFGYTDNIGTKYYIDNPVYVGINIINRSIRSYRLDDACISEAMSWMSMDDAARIYSEFNNITEYKLLDISKSVRCGKKLHTGVVAIAFISGDGDEFRCIMRYLRPNSLRKRRIVLNLSVMESIYQDALCIIPFAGEVISTKEDGSEVMQLICYDKNRSIYYIFEMTQDLYNSLLKDVVEL